MKIQFCGASTGVTGSCHLITTENHKVLLDCGQFQGGKAQEALNYEDFLNFGHSGGIPPDTPGGRVPWKPEHSMSNFCLPILP